MPSVSQKTGLSPSITKGSDGGIDLGKRDVEVDMGEKTTPSVTSGGIGVTTEITNIGGVSVTGGVSADISPIDLGINYNSSENSVSVAAGAEVPGGLLGVSGGVTIDLDTGEVTGGTVGAEGLGLGVNISASKDGGFGVGITLQIPFTPIELELGFGFPPKDQKKEPTPTPTPDNKMPSGWKPTAPSLPPFTISPGLYYVRTTNVSADGRYWYNDGNGTFNYSITPPQTGASQNPSVFPPSEPKICTQVTQQNINASSVGGEGGVFYLPASQDSAYHMGRKINRIRTFSPSRYMAPFGLINLQTELYYRRIRIISDIYGFIPGVRFVG